LATINAASLKSLVNDTTMAASSAEEIIDQSINELDTFGLALTNMTGVAGTKTLTVTSAEKGAILALAMEYYQYYRSSGSSATSVNVSGLGYSTNTSTGGSMGRIHEVAEKLAQQLMTTQQDIAFSVGQDTSDIED